MQNDEIVKQIDEVIFSLQVLKESAALGSLEAHEFYILNKAKKSLDSITLKPQSR